MPVPSPAPHRLTTVAHLAAGAAAAAGLLALAGWVVDSDALTRLHPASTPFRPVTAVGMLLAAAGLAACPAGRGRAGRWLGAAAAAVGLAKLLPWLAGYPDAVALGLPGAWDLLSPGRMAATSGAALALSGAALVLLCGRPGAARLIAAATLAASVGALGLAGVCGYLSGLWDAEFGQQPGRISVAASLGFVALGGAVLARAWADGRGHDAVQRWLPLPVGVGAAVAAVSLWHAMRVWEDTGVERAVAETAEHARGAVAGRLRNCTVALDHLARLARAGDPKDRAEAGAELRAWRAEGLLGLALVDAGGRVTWGPPDAGPDPLPGLEDPAARGRLVRDALRGGPPTLAALPDLPDGGTGVAFATRVWSADGPPGCVVGVLLGRALVTDRMAMPGYSVALLCDDREVLRRGEPLPAGERDWGSDAPLGPRDGGWRVRVWPTPRHLAERRSTLPQVTLAAGLLMAALLALTLHLAQTARQRAREAEAAEREIKAEINQRLRIQEELRQSEARFRQVVEHAADAIFVCGDDQRFVEVNQRACDSLGYARSELLGMRVDRVEVASPQAVGSASDPALPFTVDGVHRRKDGTTFPVEVRVSAVHWEGRPLRLAIARDVTERKRAEQSLAWRARLSALGADVGAALSGPGGRAEALRACVAAVVRHLDVAFARVWTLDPAGAVLELQASAGLHAGTAGAYARVPVGRLHVGRVAADGRPHLTNDLPGDPGTDDPDWARREGLAAFAGYPLVTNGRISGVLALFARHPLAGETVEALAGVAERLAEYLERCRAEDALREQRALLQRIIDHLPCAVFWKDRHSVYLGCNALCARNLGFAAPADLVGKGDREICPDPVEADSYVRHDRKVMESGRPQLNIEETQLRPDGRRLTLLTSKVPLLDARGEPAGVLGIYTDITDRKRAEEGLRLSEERYRAVVEGSLQGIIIHRGRRVLFANPAVARMLGCGRPEELVGTDVDALVVPEDLDRLRPRREAVLRGEPVEPYVEWQALRRDGSRLWVRSSLGPIAWDGQSALASFWVDVTESKRLEEQFLQSQRMEAVGRLAGGIAHDFNNLLTVVNGFAELLLGGLPPGDPLAEGLVEIRKAGERAAGLTRQLLAYSRKQILAPKVLDLNAVVNDLAPMLRRLIGEDVELVTESEPGLGRVKADPGQLEQVIMNLAVNARDAMPRGGTLTIATGAEYLDAAALGGGPDARPGPYLRLRVTDTGVGMDEATRSRIFEPFFTTKGPGEGTGLGLATVYGIVKQSGGHVAVRSEPGQGTTFSVHLPPAPEPAPGPEAAGPPPAPAPGRETVLLVEDEPGIRDVAGRALRQAGYRVLTAADGADALAVAGAHAGPVHLLVTDVVMPRVGGPELAAELARRRPGLRVLFMSGHTHGQAVPAGAAFLQKPFTPATLAGKVRETLDDAGPTPPAGAADAGPR